MSTQPIELTAYEVMLFTDRTTNGATDDGIEIGKKLLLKLGSAYLEMVGETAKVGTVTVWLTQREAWYARTLFNSGDRVDADSKLGIHMLRKLYAIILAFETAEATGDVLDAEEPDRTLADATREQTWMPPEFGLGRAKTIGDMPDEYGWEQREV